MDERYKNYLKYVKIAEQAQQSMSGNDPIEEDDTKITRVLENLKDQNYAKDFGILMYLISFGLLIVVVLQFIQLGLTSRMLVMLIPLVFFLLYRAILKQKTRSITDKKAQLALGEGGKKEKHILQIDYIKSGVELNRSRIQNTKWLYMLLTPFLLFGIIELFRGTFEGRSALWLILGASIISFLTWHFYFQGELEVLDDYEDDLDEIRDSFSNK